MSASGQNKQIFHSDFNSINFYTQRKPSLVVGAPSLNCCLAFSPVANRLSGESISENFYLTDRDRAENNSQFSALWRSGKSIPWRQSAAYFIYSFFRSVYANVNFVPKIDGETTADVSDYCDKREIYLRQLRELSYKFEYFDEDKLASLDIFGFHFMMGRGPATKPISELCDISEYDHLRPSDLGPDAEFGDNYERYPTFSMQFVLCGVLVKFRSVLHSEYFTIDISFDMSKMALETIQSIDQFIKYRLIDEAPYSGELLKKYAAKFPGEGGIVEAYNKFIDEFNCAVNNLYLENENYKNNFQGHYETLTHGVWAPLLESLAECHKSPLVVDKYGVLHRHAKMNIGGIFANIRGILISTSDGNDKAGPDDGGKFEEERKAPPAAVKALQRMRKLSLNELQARTASKKSELYIVQALLALLTHNNIRNIALDNEAVNSNMEVVACKMIRGKIIYCSKLFAYNHRSDSNLAAKNNSPLVYVAVCSTPNRWQIGRMIDRLHRVGVARLAALFNLRELEQFSNEIRPLTGAVLEVRVATKDLNSVKKQSSHIASIIQRYNDRIIGGISYRIERMRYYRSEVSETILQLGIGRIEGFQRYDEFIQRKFSNTFNFIEALGSRYEKLLSRQSSFINKMNTLESEITTNTLVSVQNTGEFVLFIIVVPYHIHELVKDAIKSENFRLWVEGALRGAVDFMHLDPGQTMARSDDWFSWIIAIPIGIFLFLFFKLRLFQLCSCLLRKYYLYIICAALIVLAIIGNISGLNR